MSEAERLLELLATQVTLARIALADEREGDFATAVAAVTTDAALLGRLVTSW